MKSAICRVVGGVMLAALLQCIRRAPVPVDGQTEWPRVLKCARACGDYDGGRGFGKAFNACTPGGQ